MTQYSERAGLIAGGLFHLAAEMRPLRSFTLAITAPVSGHHPAAL
jgi:hypothetical protein